MKYIICGGHKLTIFILQLDCVYVTSEGEITSGSIIGGSYSGPHDFGYNCYMPEKIIIENLLMMTQIILKIINALLFFKTSTQKWKNIFTETYP